METWRGKRFAPTNAVARRYEIHRATLNRWLRDEALAMPKPQRLRNRLYFDLDELDRWDEARAGRDHAVELATEREKLRKRRDRVPSQPDGEADA